MKEAYIQTSSSNTCPSCGTPRPLKFCPNCGEKKVSEGDWSIKKFVEHTIDIFTHFDGKFFNTFKYLLFYPGRLTKNYLYGHRVKQMKPVQLYVVVALAFFLLLKNWDIFFDRTQYIVYEKPHSTPIYYYKETDLKGFSLWMRKQIEKKARRDNVTFEQKVFSIDEKLPNNSKAFIFVNIPFIALFMFLSGYKKYPNYSMHLVHATHVFSFMLAITFIAAGIWTVVYYLSHVKPSYNYIFVTTNLLQFLYIFISNKKIYQDGMFKNIGRTLIVGFGFILSSILYKSLITVVFVLLA